jgi:hypothetical protein
MKCDLAHVPVSGIEFFSIVNERLLKAVSPYECGFHPEGIFHFI